MDIPIICEIPSHLRKAATTFFKQVLRLVEPFGQVKEVFIRVLDVEIETMCGVQQLFSLQDLLSLLIGLILCDV